MAITMPFAEILVSSKYGPRTWNGNPTFHTGVDFAVSSNREVKAADAGTVTRIEYTNLKGYQLEITHSAAAKTRYHMLRSDLANTVREGQYVQKNQVVGHIAPQKYSSSAAWTGPHLHFEVWLKTNSSTGPTGNWFHWNPQQRAVNAGGSGGYTPAYPSTSPATGGGTTPIESDDMPLNADDLNAIENRIRNAQWRTGEAGGATDTLENILGKIRASTLVQETRQVGYGNRLEAVHGYTAQIPGYGARLEDVQGKVNTINLGVANTENKVNTANAALRNTEDKVNVVRDRVNALPAALSAADIEKIAQRVKALLQP